MPINTNSKRLFSSLNPPDCKPAPNFAVLLIALSVICYSLSVIQDYRLTFPPAFSIAAFAPAVTLIPLNLSSLTKYCLKDTLAKLAIKAVESGKVKFHPDTWKKIY